VALLVAGCALGALTELTEVSSAALPDGRAYELVSPPDKNGGDIISAGRQTQAATSGNAVSFASLQAFSDAIGTGLSTQYIAQRSGMPGTNGWTTHAILPKLNPGSFTTLTFSKDSVYKGELAPDLSKGVLLTLTPLTNSPDVDQVANLYLRNDLLRAGDGSYTLLSSCPVCAGAPLTDPVGLYFPAFAGATPDFGHVLFEAKQNLTADAPAQSPGCEFSGCRPRLYEWDHGTLRLAGILPDGQCIALGQTPGCGARISIAGQGFTQKLYTPNSISQDGSRIFFTVPPFASATSGDLYMRLNHATTVQVNESERTDCAGDPTCGGNGIPDPQPDPNGAQPAAFQTASADGTRVFFTTSEQLTDNDTNTTPDLYMYDSSLPDSDPHNLTLISIGNPPSAVTPLVDGVMGASADGRYVYFVAQGQIVAGGPPLVEQYGLYVWHDGDVKFIGSMDGSVLFTDILGLDTNLTPLMARVTPDGKHLLFVSQSGDGLTGYNHGTGCSGPGSNPCTEVYEYSAAGDSLACVSCNPSGAPATSDAAIYVRIGTGGTAGSHINHPMSDDGTKVLFETGEKLVPEDRNGKKTDVYEYDAPTGKVHLISSGTSEDDSHFLDASPDGHDVFFSTNQRLVGWDTDNNYDLYDARVGGGFPEPPVAPAECAGGACQGAVSGTPGFAAPGSALLLSVSASGNAHPRPVTKKKPKPCAKGKVRKKVHGKVRCVKPVRKHRATKSSRARAGRRSK